MQSLSPPLETTPAAPDDDRRLLRVQAASGVLFALFLLLHLINQMLAVLGPAAYDGAQRVLRRGYQAPLIEVVLVLAPLLVHAAAAVTRLWRRRQQGTRPPRSLLARLHRWSGLVLLVFFLGHVTATRGASLIYGVYPEFAGIAYTLRWVPAYFWPYYTAFGLAALYHLVYGLGVALPVLGLRRAAPWLSLRRSLPLQALTAAGLAALLLAVLAFGGALFATGHPEDSAYARLLQRLKIAAPAAPAR